MYRNRSAVYLGITVQESLLGTGQWINTHMGPPLRVTTYEAPIHYESLLEEYLQVMGTCSKFRCQTQLRKECLNDRKAFQAS